MSLCDGWFMGYIMGYMSYTPEYISHNISHNITHCIIYQKLWVMVNGLFVKGYGSYLGSTSNSLDSLDHDELKNAPQGNPHNSHVSPKSISIDYYYSLTFLQLLYHILLLLILLFKTYSLPVQLQKCHLRLYLGVVFGFEHILRGCWDHQG
jgi:hypothetical protein